MSRFVCHRAAVLVALAAGLASPALAEGEWGRLVDEPGVQITYDACTACHSDMLVAQQGLDRDRWDKLLVTMVEDHGMEPLTEAQRTEVLDYLAAHYGPDRPNFPRP